MTLQQWLQETARLFAPAKMESTQAWLEAESLVATTLRVDRAWVLGHGETELTTSQVATLETLRQRRLDDEPLAYLTGRTNFCGRWFTVDKRVLIPRPETEEMVAMAKKHLSTLGDKPVIWDVGTGSGALAVTASLELQVPTVASDVSADALNVAQQNAEQLIPDPFLRPMFVEASLLDPTVQKTLDSLQPTGLLVLANLPYLPWSDQTKLQRSVTEFEPASALFADEEGLALNQQLLEQLASSPLSWQAILEFDPPQAEVLSAFAKRLLPGKSVEVVMDECERARFLVIR